VAGADTFSIFYDKQRMYSSGVSVAVESKEGADVSGIKTTVEEGESIVKVEIPESVSKGIAFEVVITPN
jgi:hypothetical protein